jgi:hypothetical protein
MNRQQLMINIYGFSTIEITLSNTVVTTGREIKFMK